MSGSTPIQFDLVSRANLSPSQEEEMFLLLNRHFAGVSPEQFARDLAEKNLALRLRRGEELVGFSTLLAYSTSVAGEALNVIYSGDTIVTPGAWGSSALPRAWVAGVESLRATLPPGRCFWLLLTSGFRTYRFLPVFWREFHPCFSAPTPPDKQRLLAQLARERFGAQFEVATGVVRFDHPQRLRSRLTEIPAGRACDPHIDFFHKRNPGYPNGDELVRLTEINPENLTRAGRRMMKPEANALAGHHC